MTWRGAIARNPVGQRVPVYKFPINEFLFRCLGNDLPAHWIPAVQHSLDVFEVAGEGPGFVDVVVVTVGKHPAAVGAVLDGAE